MKHLSVRMLLPFLLILIMCFQPSTAYSQEMNTSEIPMIIKLCKGLDSVQADDFVQRYSAFSNQKKQMIDKWVYVTYIKKDVPYNRDHLKLHFITVENLSEDEALGYLEKLKKL